QAAQIGQWMKSRGSKARRGRKEIDPRTALKMVIHKRLVEVIDLKKLNKEMADSEEKEEALRKQAYASVCRLMDDEGKSVTDRHDREKIVKEVLDEALGLGPLEDLLGNDKVTEIMVNRRDQTFIELKGKLVEVDANFTDDAQLLGVIERIVHPVGRRIDEKSPMVDARLPDGSRVNAIIPPLALDGPSLTIRKFSKDPLTVQNLIEFGTFTDEMADLLRACVEAKLNILISGGTGSGKTTLLNVLSGFIPPDERIVTVEDSAELQLKQPHVVRLESRPANIEGEGQVTIRDLVKNCLRMRPDRIVVGECRGAESLDMLQAMNTGHDGSLTTVHANSPRDCISRLETLVMFSGLDLPSKAIREQIASAIHIIIQQARLLDGTRKITQIAEVTGMEGPTITLQDIFVFKQEGMDEDRRVVGRFVATGFVPKFITRLEAMGIALPKGIFADVQGAGWKPSGRPAPPGRR
ncbi:MAG: CpaF family protein, partial [Armatimonadetes bacterium]|nr:CpaF family protein [Armatimonadota bacterium]